MRYFTEEYADNIDMLLAIADPDKVKQYKQQQIEERLDKLVYRLIRDKCDYNDCCAMIKVFTVNTTEDIQFLFDRIEKMKNIDLSKNKLNFHLTYEQVQQACRELQDEIERYKGVQFLEFNKWWEFWK